MTSASDYFMGMGIGWWMGILAITSIIDYYSPLDPKLSNISLMIGISGLALPVLIITIMILWRAIHESASE